MAKKRENKKSNANGTDLNYGCGFTLLAFLLIWVGLSMISGLFKLAYRINWSIIFFICIATTIIVLLYKHIKNSGLPCPFHRQYRYIWTKKLPINYIAIKMAANKTVQNIPSQEMSAIDRMSGPEFESYIAALLVASGYQGVQRTQTSGDYGIDVIGTLNGIKYGIQCKRYKKNVGVDAIYQVVGGLRHWGCDVGMVITNSYFTSNAETLAAENNVHLGNRSWLMSMIENFGNRKNTIAHAAENQLDLYARWSDDRDRHAFLRKAKKCKTIADWEDVIMGICSALVPPGRYVIGKDIPAGKYDVRAFYGNGHVTLFEADENTIKVNATMGTIREQLYYAREFKGLDCRDGDILLIELVKVELAKSEPIEFVTYES